MKQGIEQTPKGPSGVSKQNAVRIFNVDGEKNVCPKNATLSSKIALYIKLFNSSTRHVTVLHCISNCSTVQLGMLL
jgi:hypothetical protein